jgi:hypothetical protein
MLLAKVECEKISVERLVELLLFSTKQLKVWLYSKKVYASFFIDSFMLLKSLVKTLEANKVRFRFYRIEEVKYGQGN